MNLDLNLLSIGIPFSMSSHSAMYRRCRLCGETKITEWYQAPTFENGRTVWPYPSYNKWVFQEMLTHWTTRHCAALEELIVIN